MNLRWVSCAPENTWLVEFSEDAHEEWIYIGGGGGGYQEKNAIKDYRCLLSHDSVLALLSELVHQPWRHIQRIWRLEGLTLIPYSPVLTPDGHVRLEAQKTEEEADHDSVGGV